MARKTLNGKTYLMRNQATATELRKMHASYCAKFGNTDFHKWLVDRGMVYLEIKPRK